ncbi:cupin domain-containing protein [Amycolatopsis mongoliensis]|uniref:Cupin domain-containing protein n=1 Tax=Amycolatopsis mongoliensis TaxID=715475 RepID=A0A9Y2JPM3_9PSEU|nr:cupin domain-containing protein [Amycolatopsis sp. 4-36]WIY01092.1 cupin domain-containing protein [Amycolatopsis sp. 4-36]
MKPFRRIVTGHDKNGRAVFVEDATCPHALPVAGDVITLELWQHAGTPDNSGEYIDPVPPTASVPPPPGGSVLRIVEFPADPEIKPYLHRTASLDYCVVLSGQVFAVLDDDERLMTAGDVLVQRGTNHSWANRSDEPALVLFVLVDAAPLPGLPPG